MKILTISVMLCLMHISEASTYSSKLHDGEYLNSCTEIGSKVCMNCNTVGTCNKTGSTFVVTASETCTQRDTCYPPTGESASCGVINPAISPECLCNNGKPCNIDPSDNLSYVICTTDPITYNTCDAGYIDCSTGSSIERQCQVNYCFNPTDCKCYVDCPACGYMPDPDNSPSGYINCNDGSNTKGECPSGQIYDRDMCLCMPCPACGFVADPYDSPSGYIYCKDGSNQKGQCPGQVFDAEACGCVSSTTTTITTTTSTLVTCPACGFMPDPDNSSAGFIFCADGSNTKGECPSQIFDSETCSCMPCPACGFVADPYNSPSGFIFCGDGSNTNGECPGQIFDSETCSCMPCPACGFVADPYNRPSGYIYCKNGSNQKGQCPPGQVFDAEVCGCVSSTTTSITTTTSTLVPCPACGFMPDPDNSPSGYIYCRDGGNTKGQCPDQIFDGETCSCMPCPACGFVADPYNSPSGYYKCFGDVNTANNCPAGFNFNPISCYCE